MTISDRAKEVVATFLQCGDIVVDATMGNGWDTLFLAEKVGAEGQVFSFDIQEAAVESTRKKLQKAGLLNRCQLFQQGHETMVEVVPSGIGAAMFNLGYLPYADKELVTRATTTLIALRGALELLREDGGLTIVCYHGHPGGAEEAEQVLSWALARKKEYEVNCPTQLPDDAKPFLITLKKSVRFAG